MSLFHNVPGWERVARIVVGLGVGAAGAVWSLALAGELLGWLIAASGLALAATGVVGWCPLCAMAGRKLPHVDRTVTVERL